MSQQLDRLLSTDIDAEDIVKAIVAATNDGTYCDKKINNVIHHSCLIQDGKLKVPKPSCASSLSYLILKLMSANPSMIDDRIKTAVVRYFHEHPSSCTGLINLPYLEILSQSKKPSLTWLKYETMLIHLIKERLYEPKAMANEVLSASKDELHPEMASKLSSVINSCVVHCRQMSNQDEEEKEKWCEIIDWLSWFIVPEENEPF